MRTRPDFDTYGQRGVVWFSMAESDYQTLIADGNLAPEWQALIPAEGSAWRQDTSSNFNSVVRRGIYFVPRTNMGEPEAERGKMFAYTLRDLWEHDLQAAFPNDSFMTGFDYSFGAALGEYPLSWAPGFDPDVPGTWTWGGRPLYKLRIDFMQSFSPALSEFPDQRKPEWSRVASATGSKLGQPAYISYHFQRSTGRLIGANDSLWYYLHPNTQDGGFLHMVDGPPTTDYAKVLALSKPIDDARSPPWKVDIARLDNDGLLDAINNERAYTDTFAALKTYIRNTITDAALTAEDVMP